jgi:purine-binding chemotaxis protein CheW
MNAEAKSAGMVGTKPAAGKYLTFNLGNESLGIPVLKVREIIKFVPPTMVPQTPAFVKGVVNLRGKIIPVVDFRLKFGIEASAVTEHTCIIVAQVNAASRANVAMGIVVDSVDEVSNIAESDIEETPDFGMAVDVSCLVGIAKLKGKVISLLDIDAILGSAVVPKDVPAKNP